MDSLFYAFAVIVFAAVILMVEGAWLWWSDRHGSGAQRIGRRLRLMSGAGSVAAERVSILKQRRYATGERLDEVLHAMPLAAAVDNLLVQAGLQWLLARFLALTATGLLFGMLLAHLLPIPALGGWVVALLCGAAPYAIARRSRRNRLKKVEEQLPEAADFIARALRAGHSFSNVLQMAGSELPEPLAGEFRLAHEEINYGVQMNDALHNLAMRIPLTDLRYLVIAVLIQRESGGNLAEILANISDIIRARLKLLAQVRVLSAEGRMSAWILGLLPFGVVGVMSIANPQYISLLWTDPTGVRMLWYAAAMIVLGVVWLRSVIHIRV